MANVATKSALRPRVLVLSGPTASGKTSVAMKLAERIRGEVISADSAQVYVGMDVGSDKASYEQRSRVPHHAIDLVDPAKEERFSAGEFATLARDLAKNISSRGSIPIAVGGSGMYLRWFVYGAPQAPPSDRKREELVKNRIREVQESIGMEATDAERWEAAKELLVSAGDMEYAQQLKPNDYRRLKRALEVVERTGRSMSSFKAGLPTIQSDDGTIDGTQRGNDWAGVRSGTWEELDMDFRCFFLCPQNREDLYRRIDERCEQMLLTGILQECFVLWKKGLRAGSCSATQSIGYRHVLELLDGFFNSNKDEIDWEEVESMLLKHQQDTRRLATKQMTWFRGENLYRWIDSPDTSDPESIESVVEQIIGEFELARPSSESQINRGFLNKDQLRSLKAYRTKFCIFQDTSRRDDVVKIINGFKRELLA